MITYLLKSTACLLLLLLVYHFLLEREKMHHFNRYFLLFSLVFSLTIPLLTFNINTVPLSAPPDFQLSTYLQEIQNRAVAVDPSPASTNESLITSEKHYSPYFYNLLFMVYLAGALIMALRFFNNLYVLCSAIHRNDSISTGKANIVLVDDCCMPHSFFNYIFVDKEKYKNGLIAEAILFHELTHMRQIHSADILFIELLKIVLWFNPVIYFYKKAIQLNHEFLADEAVIRETENTSGYQNLLLQIQSGQKQIVLASSIYHSKTKKRLIMMTKKTTRFRTAVRKLALIPLLTGLVFIFSIRTANAQQIEEMSIFELMNAVFEKVQQADSLSDQERVELNHLLSKIKGELNHKELRSSLEQVHAKYRDLIQTYINIPALDEQREKLKSAYENIIDVNKEIERLQQEINKMNPPPPPPVPPKPADRLKKN